MLPKFDINAWCAAVQKYRCTYVYVVPPVVLLLAKHPEVLRYDLSSIRMMLCGAAPLAAGIQAAVYDRVGVRVRQGYGLSEASAVAYTQLWEDWQRKMGSVGRLLPSMEAKYMSIADITMGEEVELKEVALGEAGELWLRGPNIFLGYHNSPEATAGALTADGWCRTGDIGYQDKDGDFYITDRVKEMIKYKGFQVAPAELEGLLLGHEKVGDVAVVGVNSESYGTEVPRAYVVPAKKRGQPPAAGEFGPAEAAEIEHWLAQRISGYKRLRGGITFVSEIPKSASGKVLRRVLKEEAAREIKDEVTRKGYAKL